MKKRLRRKRITLFLKEQEQLEPQCYSRIDLSIGNVRRRLRRKLQTKLFEHDRRKNAESFFRELGWSLNG